MIICGITEINHKFLLPPECNGAMRKDIMKLPLKPSGRISSKRALSKTETEYLFGLVISMYLRRRASDAHVQDFMRGLYNTEEMLQKKIYTGEHKFQKIKLIRRIITYFGMAIPSI